MRDSFSLDTIAPTADQTDLSLAAPNLIGLIQVKIALQQRIRLEKIGLFIISLFLFILALNLMKEGARSLTPLIRTGLDINSAVNSLGCGWLFSYLILSGSPVAAAALTFFDAGAVDKLGAYAMITGSRLGASFIVLFIGFIYVLRGRDRATSLSMGLLSLTVTGTIYAVAFFIGAGILQTRVLNWVQFRSGMWLGCLLDLIFDPITNKLTMLLPHWSFFIVGLGLIVLSFNLFDRCLPHMAVKQNRVGQPSRLIYRRWVMFACGAAITLLSMSVSVSLSILLPLSQRGFIRRENVIPYIMGANITTFIDTLLASILLDNPAAFAVVWVQMLSITLVSIFILTLMYRHYERAMLNFVAWVTASNRNLALFMVIIFVLPVFLMLA